jgi:hypothetical protein
MRPVLFSYFRQRRKVVCYWSFGRCLFHLKILPEPHVFTVQWATTVKSWTLKSVGSTRLEDFTTVLLRTETLPDLNGAITDVSSDLGAFHLRGQAVLRNVENFQTNANTSHHKTPNHMYFPFKETVPVLPSIGVPITQGTAFFPVLGQLWYRPPQCQAHNLNDLFPHKWPIDYSSESAQAQEVGCCESGNGNSGCLNCRKSD